MELKTNGLGKDTHQLQKIAQGNSIISKLNCCDEILTLYAGNASPTHSPP